MHVTAYASAPKTTGLTIGTRTDRELLRGQDGERSLVAEPGDILLVRLHKFRRHFRACELFTLRAAGRRRVLGYTGRNKQLALGGKEACQSVRGGYKAGAGGGRRNMASHGVIPSQGGGRRAIDSRVEGSAGASTPSTSTLNGA